MSIDDTVIQLAYDLCDTMKVQFGAGLAATQIGDSRSMVVISSRYAGESTLPHDPLLTEAIVLINPEIEIQGEGKFKWEEACLSVPNYSDIVERHDRIRLRYKDLSDSTHCVELCKTFSGIVQHEVDHLEGLLYLDRLSASRKKKAHSILLSRMRKRREEQKKAAKKDRIQKEKPEIRKGFRPAGAKETAQRKKRVKKSYGKNKKNKR